MSKPEGGGGGVDHSHGNFEPGYIFSNFTQNVM